MRELEVVTEYIGGNCPVQAEGTIDGRPFYFRARGTRWTMGIGGDPVSKPDWFYEEPYGDNPSAAGWMTVEEAEKFIAQAVKQYDNFLVTHAE